jgi:AcrR family transcriptional regulator
MMNQTINMSDKGRDRRLQILRKAAEEFALRGYHTTSVANILEGLNIARGTFYQYFANKHSIFDEILNGLLKKIADVVQFVEPDLPNVSPIGQIRTNVLNVIHAILEDKAMAKVLLSGATGQDREFDRKVKEFYDRIRDLIIQSIVQGKKNKIIRNVDEYIVANCVLGCMKEIIAQTVDSNEKYRDLNYIIDQLMDHLAYGIFIKSA